MYYVPRLGSKQVHIYVLICSLLGAFTVTACKGLAVGLKEIFTHEHTFSIWLTVACAVVIIVCIIVQMVYLNRALDLFSTPIVTTVYYVLFTTCVLITSGVMFREWRRLSLVDIAACLVGFLTTICGLVLINYLKSSALPSSGPPLAHADRKIFSPSFDRRETNDSVLFLQPSLHCLASHPSISHRCADHLLHHWSCLPDRTRI